MNQENNKTPSSNNFNSYTPRTTTASSSPYDSSFNRYSTYNSSFLEPSSVGSRTSENLNIQNDLRRLQTAMDSNFGITNRHIDLTNKFMDITILKISTVESRLGYIETKLNTILDKLNKQNNNNNKNRNKNRNNSRFQHGQYYYPDDQNYVYTPLESHHQPNPHQYPTQQPQPQLPKKKSNPAPTPSQKEQPVFDVTFHIEDEVDNKNYKDSNVDGSEALNPFNMLGPLIFKQLGAKKEPASKPHNNIESDTEDDEATEYNSEDEFEELELEIKTLDDLIDIGKLYETLIKESKQEQDDTTTTATSNATSSTTSTTTEESTDSEHSKEDVEEKVVEELSEDTKDEELSEDTKNEELSEDSTENLKKEIDGLNSDVNKVIDCLEELFIGQSNNKTNQKPEVQNKSRPSAMLFRDGTEKNKKLKKKNFKFGKVKQLSPVVKDDAKAVKAVEKKSSVYELNGKKYSINLKILNSIRKPLLKLKSMIGLTQVKNSIVDMIIYYLQGFENKNKNMLHTVIEGPPGVGKTQLGKIFAEIYAGLGVIPSNKFKLVKRTDLIGEYLGHTSHKTQQAIDDADGGVLFIDEAYSLGNSEKKDSFSKECIDTINQNLSENKKKFICIIAGYPIELEKCFFSYNPGLKRRFPFRYTIDGYQPDELRDIFLKKITDSQWKINGEELNKDELSKFFTEQKDNLPHFGGDIENLLMDCKFMHSRRVVGKHPKLRRKLIKQDIEDGFARFKKNKKEKDNDIYLEFLNETTEKTDDKMQFLSLKDLYRLFKEWYRESYSSTQTSSKSMSRKELEEYMEKNEYSIEKGNIYGIILVKDEIAKYVQRTLYA